jgi:putative FmdB family regulatory protein
MTHLKRAEGCRVPIYEYDCQGCRRRVSLLIRTLHGGEAPRCPRCGSLELSRLMSRFVTVKSEDARLDALSDPGSFGDLDEAMDEAMAEGDGDAGGEEPAMDADGGAGDDSGAL